MLRPEFVERKLGLITEDLGRLATFRRDSYETLVNDSMRLATLERILERIVMRAIDVNEHLIAELATGEEDRTTRLTYRDTFLKLAEYNVVPRELAAGIAPSAGLRNILVHEYNDVDHRIVYGSISTTLERFPAYIDGVRGFLGRAR